ncbi:glycosyltransferase family 4 protein [Nocardioides sp.]|uniref:glycosyltransferase family 4 protein n=1 Tax=Nocardioides sp. TaxID=35761 RepID=UPI002ECFDBB4
MSAGAPLTVLHVSEVTWGGVVTLVDHFTTEQVRAGHRVHLLTPDAYPTEVPGVARHRWQVRRNRPNGYPAAVRELRRVVDEVRPDVLHLHSFVAGQLGRWPRALRGLDIPVVYQAHAWSDRLFSRAAAAAAVRLAERAAARRTDRLVTNCQAELDRGHEIGVRVPGDVLSVAVDLDHLRPPTDEDRRKARASLGIGDDEFAALVLGRIAFQKGQDLLVPAWETRRPDGMVLYLVGPGEVADLAAAAPTTWGRSIRFMGGTDDVRPWLWAVDALVLSSRYETVALVVAEAMACRVPVVATDVDGPAEVLLEGEEPPAGTVVPVDRPDLLIEAAVRLQQDPQLAQAHGTAGVRRAQTRFAPGLVAQRLETAYRTAIADRERKPR